jgi:transcriptional regulator with XRE-family HTH domain
MIDRMKLRIELARKDMVQADIAKMIGTMPTTLSSWLNGRHAAPGDLARRIERALGIRAGALSATRGTG